LYINSFASLAVASDSLVSAIFSYRFLYTTTNAGASWRKDTLPGLSRYNALAVRPADCVWVVGDSGKILRFGTDGAGYLPQRSGTTANLLSISALDTLNILVTGQQGTLLETTDGGSSWQRIAVPVAVNLNAVYFVNRNLAWIVGDSGVVMQYRNGMLSDAFEHARISQSFVLNHCYPNPFNPSTRISFYLNSGGFVRLEAYDVAGRLADILLQQNESTGSHVVEWTPSRLSSGVYFITLKMGSGVSFQKVVFIR